MSWATVSDNEELLQLKEAMQEYLDAEEKRLTALRDYLLAVQDGLSGGSSSESSSSDLTSIALFSDVSAFLPSTEE